MVRFTLGTLWLLIGASGIVLLSWLNVPEPLIIAVLAMLLVAYVGLLNLFHSKQILSGSRGKQKNDKLGHSQKDNH